MADNIAITAGAGTSVATDQVGSDHYQKIKLALGAADTANLASVGSGAIDTGTLRVALATDSPGVATLGNTTKSASLPVTIASDEEAIGVIARAHGTNPTATTAGSRLYLAANRAGIPFIIGGHPNSIVASVRIASATSNLSLITVATGLKAVVTQLWIRADKANSGNTSVQIGFGAAATPTPAATPVTGLIIDEDLGAGDGHQLGGGMAIVAVGSDFHDLFLTTENPTAGNITVGYTYYTIES